MVNFKWSLSNTYLPNILFSNKLTHTLNKCSLRFDAKEQFLLLMGPVRSFIVCSVSFILAYLFFSSRFQCVYQGTSHTCKVNRLQEMTMYRFRIAAANGAGQGHYSEIYEFSTCIAPPSSLKGILLFYHFILNLKSITTKSRQWIEPRNLSNPFHSAKVFYC